MTAWLRRGLAAVRRFLAELVRRSRERGRTALFRALRIAGATVAAFVVAEAVGLSDPPPLVAALTALLVVQATLASTLVNGVQRVLAVVLGVTLAVGFVSVVGLNWWSLGILVAASIISGQILRLGPHLLEVPISAMLVLGVGYLGGGGVDGRSAGSSRPSSARPSACWSTSRSHRPCRPVSRDRRWRSTRGRSRACWSRRPRRWPQAPSNPTTPSAGSRTRGGSTATHRRSTGRWPKRTRAAGSTCAPSARRRSSAACARGWRRWSTARCRCARSSARCSTARADQPDAAYAEQVRLAAAALLSEMAAVVRTFGDLIRDEIEEPGAPDEAELTAALDALRHHRAQVEALLLDDPRSRVGLWEFNSVLLTVTDRMLAELDVVEHARLRAELGDAVRARLRAAAALERLRDTTVGRIGPHEHEEPDTD